MRKEQKAIINKGFGLCTLFAVLLLGLAARNVIAAETSEDAFLTCKNDSATLSTSDAIGACDKLLGSGQLPDKRKAKVLTYRGQALYADGLVEAAIDDFENALTLEPTLESARGGKVFGFIAIGRVRQAQRDLISLIDDAVAGREAAYVHHIREISVATGPHRNGVLARRVVEIIGPELSENAPLLETAAAAYASDRNFDFAVRKQFQALKLAGQSGESDLSGYRARLELYKSKRALVCPGMQECW